MHIVVYCFIEVSKFQSVKICYERENSSYKILPDFLYKQLDEKGRFNKMMNRHNIITEKI